MRELCRLLSVTIGLAAACAATAAPREQTLRVPWGPCTRKLSTQLCTLEATLFLLSRRGPFPLVVLSHGASGGPDPTPRLARVALLPPARLHLTSFHGTYAAHATLTPREALAKALALVPADYNSLETLAALDAKAG